MLIKRKKLLNRLIVITLSTTLVPLLLAGLYLIPKTNYDIRKVTNEQLYSQAVVYSNFIQEHLLSPLHFFMQDFAIYGNTLLKAKLKTFLDEYPQIKSYVQTIIQIEPANNQQTTVLYSKENQPPYSVLQNHPFISAISSDSSFGIHSKFVSSDSTTHLLMSIKSRNRISYIAVLDLSPFFNAFTKFVLSQKLDSSFRIINKDDWATVFQLQTSKTAMGKTGLPDIFIKPSNMDLPFYQYNRSDKKQFVGAYSDISSFINLRIAVEIPKTEAEVTNRSIWYSFSALLLLGVILSLIGTTYYWRRITNPLERFARSATEIARGDFSQKIKLESDDEIGRLAKIFNYMVIELRRLHAMNLNKIITERTKTKTIIKNIADGVIVTDQNDRIITLNVAVEKWFNILEKDKIEQPIDHIIHDKGLLNLIEEIKETGLEGTFTREIPLNLPGSAKEHVFQARATKIVSQEETFMGVVTILRDITREKEIDRMKTELVSMVAHELRTPLTSISGFAELLLMPDETRESILEYAKIIKEETDRLTDLVNKFLDITRIEEGRMDFNPKQVPIKQILDSVLYLVSTQAQQKYIELQVDLESEECEIYADERMMSEVILNLLSNAVKYSPQHSRVVFFIKEREESVHIIISDQGFGISAKHLPHIFEKFYRIKDDPRVQEERGTGLGLALVKEIVDLHHGHIFVESTPEQGTTFEIALPLKKESALMQTYENKM